MILMIDNFDSFTYNIVQMLGELGAEVATYRNNAISIDEIIKMAPQAVIISPGPGNPDSAGISLEVIHQLAGKLPIYGICLGHQTIGQAFGGNIVRAKKLMHGKSSPISHDNQGLFKGLSQPFDAIRYHSLVIDKATLPECLSITAESDDGEIMGVRHKSLPIEGVQFHPESVLTIEGRQMLQNLLEAVS